MEFLGVGPLELFFILIIALIFLGPRDMVKAGRTMGKYMRKIVMSPTWRMVQQTSRELRTLPNRMIREAGMEEDIKDLDQLRKDLENQIGSIRKPLSATASEINDSVKGVNRDLAAQSGSGTQGKTAMQSGPVTQPKPAAQASSAKQIKSEPETQSEPAAQTDIEKPADLSAWTTRPPAAETEDGSTGEQVPASSGAPENAAPPAENQTPKES